MDFKSIGKMAEAGYVFAPTDAGMTRSNRSGWPELATSNIATIEEWLQNGDSLVSVARRSHQYITDIDDPIDAVARGFKMEWLDGTYIVDTPGGGLHASGLHDDVSNALPFTSMNVRAEKNNRKSKLIVELKLHNATTAAPSVKRFGVKGKKDGVYQPRCPFNGVRVGINPDLLAWVQANMDDRAPQSHGRFNGVHPDFVLDAFLHTEGCTEFSSGLVNGAHHVIVDACPHCGRKAIKNTTLRAGITKFIFGGMGVGFICQACGIDTMNEHREKMAEQDEEYTPWKGYIYKVDDPELLAKIFPVEMVTNEMEDEEVEIENEVNEPGGEVKIGYQGIREEIDAIMRLSDHETKDHPATPTREKHRRVFAVVYKHMLKHGKLYDCGNVATYLEGSTQELIQIVKGSARFNRLLMRYGVLPTDRLCDSIGQSFGARATTDASKTTIYNLSFYDRDNHTLYVNEYGGNFLKIGGDGHITRHRNGEFDMLFSDGTDAQCDPLCADIDMARIQLVASTLNASDGLSLMEKEILDVILYDESKIGREAAHMTLMLSILALFLYERVPSYPYPFLFGAGSAMKSALAVRVGKLIQGKRFKVRFAEDDVQQMKDMAISLPFLVLDEANNVKKLTNLLKAVGTGAMDSRRELYTTAKMRYTPYQARIWMTANTASLTNETISSRMLIIDAAPRTEAEPFRSEHYLEWTQEKLMKSGRNLLADWRWRCNPSKRQTGQEWVIYMSVTG
jgi:hypothetical protein